MRLAGLFTAWVCLISTATVLHAAHRLWAPAPAAEVIKNADCGRKPTVDEVEAETAKIPLKNSGLGGFFFTRLPFMPYGIPWRAYIHVRDAGPGGAYQFGWAQALRSEAGAVTGALVGGEVMYIFFQDGKMTWLQTKRRENCLQPVAATISPVAACAELGTPLPRPPGSPPAPSGEGTGGIHEAARNNESEKVKALLLSDPEQVFSTDQNSLTPLHWAAVEGHKDVAAVLLASSADVNAKTNRDWTPLHYAVANGHLDVVQLLLANKADVNAQDASGLTPLHVAACWGRKNVAELVLANHADVNARDHKGSTPLFYASTGPSPGEETDGMEPPRGRHPDVAKLLRQHGGRGAYE